MSFNSTGEPSCTMRYIQGLASDPTDYGEISRPFPDTEYSFISDEEPGFMRFGSVRHRQISASPVMSSATYMDGTLEMYVNTLGVWMGTPGLLPENLENTLDISGLYSEAFVNSLPSMDSNFSLINFLLELRDIKRMFEVWNRSKSLISNVASQNLNWEFGWKPFISDLQAIYQSLVQFKDRLNEFKSLMGQPLTRHYQIDFGESHTSQSYTGGYRGETTFKDVVFNTTFRYVCVAPQIDTLYGQVCALLDALGVKPLSIIWEAIPFSFVVDWFINVGDFLSNIDDDFVDLRVTVLDACYSLKYNDLTETYRDVTSGTLHLGTYSRKTYIRQRAIPTYSDFGVRFDDKFGTKQFVLSASLLLA